MDQESQTERSVNPNGLNLAGRLTSPGIDVPIIPGIMPIQTYSSFLRLTKLCGTRVPPSLLSILQPICVSRSLSFSPILQPTHCTCQHDDQNVKDFGVTLAVEMIRKITVEGGVRGVHFCTLNLEKSVQRILESLQWTALAPPVQNQLIAVWPLFLSSLFYPKFDHRFKETPGPIIHAPPPDSALVITPGTATDTAARSFHTPVVDGDGHVERNNATWDDFPNGRFGDFTSPAFGIQGPWGGPSISVCLYFLDISLL